MPDVILKELKKGTNINFETDTYKEMRDVVTTFVHNHTNTTMPMDIEKRLLSVTEGGGAGGDDDERKEHNESQDNKIENEVPLRRKRRVRVLHRKRCRRRMAG